MNSSSVDAYRLWQLWQQMHYPTPLPSTSEIGVDLVALDGKAGTSLERFFEQPPRGVLDDECRASFEECVAELDVAMQRLDGDAARYFARLLGLVRLIMGGDAQHASAR